MSDLFLLLSRIPPEAFPALGRVLSALISGDRAAAAREAHAAAETVAARRAIHEAFSAGKRNAGTGE